MIPAGKAELVTTDGALAELLAHLRAAGSFAYDSEFIGELTYVPKLCLIQVATTERVALIDPLADLDLTPFWELIADGSVEKIVHAGLQDIEPVVRILNKPAARIFDTQIAAGLAGMTYPLSLSKLVYELVGYKLGKGLTFSHWDQRPLSASQLRYGADDVRFLPAAREELKRRLERLKHAKYADEESCNLCDPNLQRFDPESQYLKIRGANGLPATNLAALRELVRWRDTVARENDAPPRGFLKDEVLLDLARTPIRSVEKLGKVRGLPRPVEERYGRELVEAVERGLKTAKEDLPEVKVTEETPREKFRTDSLWAAVQTICIGKQVDPMLLTSRQEVSDLMRVISHGGNVESFRLMKGWRRVIVGEPILQLLAGTLQCRISWKEDGLAIEECGEG
jgi:ribonuclease D